MTNLKELRLKKGLTQEELCKDLEKVDFYITRSAYSRYETGSRVMSADVLVKFAFYYNTSTDCILGISGE